MKLPPLPSCEILTDLAKEVGTRERVSRSAVEKDFYLKRMIWALAERFGEKRLLRGGTLLSKVDLGYYRMSEDVDLVMPIEGSARAVAASYAETSPSLESETLKRKRRLTWSSRPPTKLRSASPLADTTSSG
jgi:predicted nucleotidyltransferase component of viral defense system